MLVGHVIEYTRRGYRKARNSFNLVGLSCVLLLADPFVGGEVPK